MKVTRHRCVKLKGCKIAKNKRTSKLRDNGLQPPPPPPFPKTKLKKHKSGRHDDITHYTLFTLQPKSDSEIGWGPLLVGFWKIKLKTYEVLDELKNQEAKT